MKIQAEGRASTKALNGMSRASLRNRKKGQELGNRDNDKVCDWKQGYAGQVGGASSKALGEGAWILFQEQSMESHRRVLSREGTDTLLEVHFGFPVGNRL